MPGSLDFDPYAVSLAGSAVPVGVFRYDPHRRQTSRIRWCRTCGATRSSIARGPSRRWRGSVTCWMIPPGVRLPVAVRAALAAGCRDGPYVVQSDERIVVLATAPNGRSRVLFDGFAQVPQVELSPTTQHVSFLAVGVAIRCWDSPIGGRYQRHADDPQAGAVVSVDLPTRFNPDGRPNCTPVGYDVNQSDPTTGTPSSWTRDSTASPTRARSGRWESSCATSLPSTTTRSMCRTRTSPSSTHCSRCELPWRVQASSIPTTPAIIRLRI